MMRQVFVPSDMPSWVWPWQIINSPKWLRLIQISRSQRAESSKSQTKDCSKGSNLELVKWCRVSYGICPWEGMWENLRRFPQPPASLVCCRVLQYVAACCSAQEKNVKHSAASFVWYCSVCCSVLQCTAVCCSMLQRATMCYSSPKKSRVRCL